MGVRSSLAALIGGTRNMEYTVSALPPGIEQGLVQAGMDPTRPFNPGEPLPPADGYGNTPRSRDYLTGVNISTRPRLNEQVSFSTLKALVDNYDVAQICIWHRIDSLRSLGWHLAPNKGFVGDSSALIALGERVLARPDRESTFKNWLAKYLFDILAYDAGCLYKLRNGAGQVIGLRVLDGTTIAPLLDYWGNRPTGEAPAYVQFAQGVPWEWLFDTDIVYQPFRPRSDTLYGKAPLETILLNANTDLRFQNFFLNHFTEGNIPEGFAGSPEGWTPGQIEQFQEKWDALLYGDDTQKHQLKWVPYGTKFDWTRNETFDDRFSLFLMRKTSAAYHVVPADLGFTEDVNRASGDTQADVQFRVGDLPLLLHVQEQLSVFLHDDLHLPLNFVFDTGREIEDRLVTAQAHKIYIEAGVISPSEVREDVYGLDEPDGVPVPRFIFSSRAGPVPLSALYAVAGPTDKDTAAPVPGAALPHKPFSPVEGVAPQKPPASPPLAVTMYPQDNPTSAAAEAVTDAAPVLKDGGTGPGISVADGTVASASPLLAPAATTTPTTTPEDEDTAAVAKAEMAAFRRYARRRAASGAPWRDFVFRAVPAAASQELNRRERAQVRKAAGQVSVAGLCVLAADTGRVLILQRGLSPDDPAGGTWEFPGGHLEDGETVLQGALREWCEETGCPPPPQATVVSQWTSSNGVYQGVVVEVPHEAEVPINPPTDPDGDTTETVAWWDPAQLAGNPAVRPELAADLSLVLDAVTTSPVAKATPDWSQHPVRRVEDDLLDYYGPQLHSAMSSLVSKDSIRAAVARYLAQQ